MARFDMNECDIDEETGHLLCNKPEETDYKELESSPRNEIEGDGIVSRKRTEAPDKDLEVV